MIIETLLFNDIFLNMNKMNLPIQGKHLCFSVFVANDKNGGTGKQLEF
jgi:hypothetical protein